MGGLVKTCVLFLNFSYRFGVFSCGSQKDDQPDIESGSIVRWSGRRLLANFGRDSDCTC